jgi:hypothetical protein
VRILKESSDFQSVSKSTVQHVIWCTRPRARWGIWS